MPDLDGRAFVSDGRSLWPADLPASEYLASIGKGKQVLITARKARSIDQHRYFFALLRCVVNATDQWIDEEECLKTVKDALNFYVPFRGRKGERKKELGSISFKSLDGNRFRKFFDATMLYFQADLGLDPIALLEEVDQVAPRPKSIKDWSQGS